MAFHMHHWAASTGQLVKTTMLIAVVLIFIILISVDAVKALKKRAHWIPGDLLVLSALSIQLLNLLSAQGLGVGMKPGANEFWMIHTSRLMLCVVVAYLIPGMAKPGSEENWTKWMALTLTIFLHVTSELYIVHHQHQQFYPYLWVPETEVSEHLYIAFATLISISFVLLILLLGCANIAGRGIERIVAQKIPIILKEKAKEALHHQDHHYEPRCRDCWITVENAVLRAWIVARAYSVDYVVARSALASSAATIVSFQIVITIVGVLHKGYRLEAKNMLDWLRVAATVLQCVFILIGWFIIIWRWATAVAYYRNWQTLPAKSFIWRGGLRVEDFWTRHLIELQQAKEPRLNKAEELDARIKGVVANEEINLTAPKQLLYAVAVLQWVTVVFSKACWLASLMIFQNKLVRKLLFRILSRHINAAFKDYSKYERILEGMQMLEETPQTLWLANRKSIVKAKKLIEQGNEDGKKCEILVDFLADKRNHSGRLGRRFLEPYKLQRDLKYLCQERPQEEENGILAVEEHFADASTMSWKMTAVSLLGIIIHLAPLIYAELDKGDNSASHSLPPKATRDCLDAYLQAWEIIDFVEETDTEANRITSQAADRYFVNLQRKAKDGHFVNKPMDRRPQGLRAALEELKKEHERKTMPPGSCRCTSALLHALGKEKKQEAEDKKESDGGQSNLWKTVGGNDSLDWKVAASSNTVYKLCNSIQCDNETDANDLLKELESSLADIINECLEKSQYLLFLNSKKWARHSNEKMMGKALYTVGKARLIKEKLDEKEDEVNQLSIVPPN